MACYFFQILMNVERTQTHALNSVLTPKEVIPVVVMVAIGLMLMGSPAMVHPIIFLFNIELISILSFTVYIRIIHII